MATSWCGTRDARERQQPDTDAAPPVRLMWLAALAVGAALATTQVGDDHLDRAWGPLVHTMSTRPTAIGFTSARYGAARHLFVGRRASWGWPVGPHAGTWLAAEVVRLVWWVPVEARRGLQLDHTYGAWGFAARTRSLAGWHTGVATEVGLQVGTTRAGVVRTAALERATGPFVAAYVWWGNDGLTVLGGAGSMWAGLLGPWASAAVAVDLHERWAVQVSARASYERRSGAAGLAWTGPRGWRASASALVTGSVALGSYAQIGPWMPHVELGWGLRSAGPGEFAPHHGFPDSAL